MDIFAAQLKRLTRVPIRQKRVKINAPHKGSASRALTDDLDHYENHQQYFALAQSNNEEARSSAADVDEKNLAADKDARLLVADEETAKLEENADLSEHEFVDSAVIPEFIAYAKKPRIPREELKQLEAAKKSLKHLDLFI